MSIDGRLIDLLRGVITECIKKRGFKLPLYAACIAKDGGTVVLRYATSDLQAEIHALNWPDPVLIPPININILVCDSVGKSAKSGIDIYQHPADE